MKYMAIILIVAALCYEVTLQQVEKATISDDGRTIVFENKKIYTTNPGKDKANGLTVINGARYRIMSIIPTEAKRCQ